MPNKISKPEIRAAAALVLIALSVLIFLPNKTIDPWQIFNPQRFGLIVVVIAAMQFCGYLAIRLFGDNLGVLLMGFFGGLVSSTAVFATLPRFLQGHPERLFSAVAAAILAILAMLIELSVIVMMTSPELFYSISHILGSMFLVGLICSVLIYRRSETNLAIEEPSNPLDFKSVLYLSSVIGGMIFIIALVKYYIGPEAVEIVSFLGGFFEVHSVTLAAANLFSLGKLSLIDAKTALLGALLSSFVTKLILLWWLARNHFAAVTSFILLLMVATGIIATLI